MAKKYTGKDIDVLEEREHVRLRTSIFLGNMNLVEYSLPIFTEDGFIEKTFEFVPSVYVALSEVIDNSIDELTQLNRKTNTITIDGDPENGEYVISDNGRGIPIDKHSVGKHTPEVVLGMLRSGRNFGEKEVVGIKGMNGVGVSCVNFCSEYLKVNITRDGKRYKQTFLNGASTIKKPSITKGPTKTGTEISFKLDPEVFKNGVGLPEELVRSRAMEIAFNNPGLTVKYKKETFKFKNGFTDVLNAKFDSTYTFKGKDMGFHLVLNPSNVGDTSMYSWVNTSQTLDGSLTCTQFFNAFTSHLSDFVASKTKLKNLSINKSDLIGKLLTFGIVKLNQPEYDGQNKLKQTGPNMRTDVNAIIEKQWKHFQKTNKDWLEDLIEHVLTIHDKQKVNKAKKTISKSSKNKIVALRDANGKNRQKCKLLITEGLSAASNIGEVRDTDTMGIFALTGKINNVYDKRPSDVLSMVKLKDVLAAIGLIPGSKADPDKLHFGEIVIASDADPDGDDICTLLVNLFFKFWPELFSYKRPVVYRLKAPNIIAIKGDKRVHFATKREYEQKGAKYKNWNTMYCKGLGSMLIEDWQTILYEDKYMVPITDDGTMSETMKLLFSQDVDARKEWLKGDR